MKPFVWLAFPFRKSPSGLRTGVACNLAMNLVRSVGLWWEYIARATRIMNGALDNDLEMTFNVVLSKLEPWRGPLRFAIAIM